MQDVKMKPHWIRTHAWSAATLAVLALVLLIGAPGMFAKPRLDRNWVEHLAHMPAVDLRADAFALALATDWSYAPEGPVAKEYTSFAASFDDLKEVWFVVEPHPGLRPMAHTLVIFEFADDRVIGLTIEARREAHEAYSAFWGAFNRFELAYIWSTPKDLLTRRAVMLDHDVLVYPLALSQEQKHAFLRATLEKTIAISSAPRFYNTLHSNCTNELAKTAGLGWHYSFVLTGFSAERLFALGMIPGEDFATTRERAILTDEIKALNGLASPEFSRALLRELRARGGENS
jgi:hypothetical protein